MAITSTKEEIIAKRGYRKDIQGDQYSLYLSNYPVAAKYLAGRLENKGRTLVELCSSVGVTLEVVASKFVKLIGVELNPEALECCSKNLETAGILNKVELILGDVTDEELLKTLKADVVIYDIPYWVSKELPDGTNVLDKNPDLGTMLANIRKHISKNIVVFAPPYLEYEAIEGKLGEEMEYQRIYINGRYDRNYLFFGNLIETVGITEKRLEYSLTQG